MLPPLLPAPRLISMLDEHQIPVEFPPPRQRRVNQRDAVKKAELRAARQLYRHLKKLEELAMGILVAREDKKTGQPNIYAVPPDRAALEYLIDRGMGKTPSRVEITGEEGGPLEILPWIPAEPTKRAIRTTDLIEGEVIPVAEEEEGQGKRKDQEDSHVQEGPEIVNNLLVSAP